MIPRCSHPPMRRLLAGKTGGSLRQQRQCDPNRIFGHEPAAAAHRYFARNSTTFLRTSRNMWTKQVVGRSLSVALATAVGGGLAATVFFPAFTPPPTAACQSVVEPEVILTEYESPSLWWCSWDQVKRFGRLVRRLVQLSIVLSPVFLLYPFTWLLTVGTDDEDDTEEDANQVVLAAEAAKQSLRAHKGHRSWSSRLLSLYYDLCLHCVEYSGAATIKCMQWAGSRPDMFGSEFCAVFSKLQDDTTPHSWKATQEVLREAYGEEWQDHISLDPDHLLGSGCIAQVYKGSVTIDDQGNRRDVAVKVMHPNVQDDIAADLDLMRVFVRAIQKLPIKAIRDLKWLNLEGVVEELGQMLEIQLDLRTEAAHLQRFHENFEGDEYVVFPELLRDYPAQKHILVESFCEGVPILEFARNNNWDPELRTRMCTGAIQAVCKMIFLDNFVHGDLHPGNILVSPDPSSKNGHKFVLLDVGIVKENTEEDHVLISDILASFIRKDGRKAGRLMIADSTARTADANERVRHEEQFVDKIEKLTIRASGPGYLMEHLGSYISYICRAAATHHVMMNPAWVSMALAVKLQEAVALSLDPSVEVWKIAIPIILEGERRRGMVAQRASELLGAKKLFDWIFSSSSDNKTSHR